MDYEEKYKEALERAKRWAEGTLSPERTTPKGVCEVIFPELAESEDERIREWLITQLQNNYKGNYWATQAIAYLEKQKEPHYTKRNALFDKCVENCDPEVMKEVSNKVDKMLGKEQKPSCWNSPVMTHEMIMEKQKEPQNKSMAHEDSSQSGILTSPLCNDKNLDDIAQEYVEGVKEYNPTPDWNLIHTAVCYGYHLAEQKEQKPVVTHGETYHVDTLGTQQVIAGKMPQKLAEWSEEDWSMLGNVVGYIDGTGSSSGITKKEKTDWLYSLPKRFNLQPKQEWNEEDSKRYISIGTTLGTSVVLSKEDYDANMAWLRELVNAKKYSGPRPSWKPSEEQMSMLLAVIRDPNNAGAESCYLALESLNEDLNKLIKI